MFLDSKTGASHAAWDALSDSERAAKQQQGMVAWGAWVAKNHGAMVEVGGPLGKTKQVSHRGIAAMSAFTGVRAPSQEAAARLFECHPHFTHFPDDRVEVMRILALPDSAAG